ncbi:NAD(P)-dependent oxidoreductase [Gluconacetobacter azotocaptans]|uniref:NAD(P)-dependent oxidoreductase n=1 Tax=Gluconacetobacter azotocaptans TaxID=142834 RepID=UPI00195602A6|nr:NAD(P)-dependent oxidoreductase [Gluconacetobacter azotocaptans]MBM9401467.1 NAD(P)-dependent oxidoreductase [Gluconacetobacter azotocaptans]
MISETPRIGFIGLGQMGLPIAGRLMDGAVAMAVHTRTRAGAGPLLDRGASWADGPAGIASASDIVFTMLGYPEDVEAIYLGPDGLLAHARPGQIFLDLTTSSPDLAGRIAAVGAQRGVAILDAPVSGGVPGARAGMLSVMVGGDVAAFDAMRGLLSRIGSTIARFGGPGAGQQAKICNQIVIAGTMMGVCEGLSVAARAGLDMVCVLDTLGGGAAGGFLLKHMGPRIVAGDYVADFYVRHFVKDLGLALAEADKLGMDLPATALARGLYRRLAAQGAEGLGTQALARLYQPAEGEKA